MTESMIEFDSDRFEVIFRDGSQQIERDRHALWQQRYVVTDGWKTDWIILYDHKPEWASDGVLAFNQRIRSALDIIAKVHCAEVEHHAGIS